MEPPELSLVIFTCYGREQLLYNTWTSFKQSCDYPFTKTIMAIDGKISHEVIEKIQPDVIIQSPLRRGYLSNILLALKAIDSQYFFWLEDDWCFKPLSNFKELTGSLRKQTDWVQVAYSKHEPKAIQAKIPPIADSLYKNPNGFTTNPGICRTELVKQGFNNLLQASKEERAGNEGFEYFVSRYFERQGLVCVIHEPADGTIISHEGYLESTPRNWHMTNSIDQSAENYLLAMPKAPLWRRFLMASRLTVTFFKLAFKQFVNNEIYELSFRILAAVKNTGKNG